MGCGEHVARLGQHADAGGGEADGAAGPVQQPDAQDLLEGAEIP